MPMVVVEKAFNIRIILCYIRKPCSVASVVGNPSVTPKGNNVIDSSPGNKGEVIWLPTKETAG